MPDIYLYNSLTRRKEKLEPITPGHVRLYACGPTVYNYAHIGNARQAVVFDQLVRVLRTQFRAVTYVSNITDVDDKIIAAARETGEPAEAITQRFTRIYNEDMAALGVARPDIQPHATTHIEEMIALIRQLIDQGHAYSAEDGHVLFYVPGFAQYGALSGRSREEQIAGARVEVASNKRDPADFVLWKPAGENEPGWDSPWGRGRPGWHIECSAMAEKHLSLPFDIHGGGADLKFPHHENEIAQSCCAHGEEDDLSAFARMWVHNGFLTVEGEKMSKSLGNIILAHDLIEQDMPGELVRLTLLSAQYSQPLDWSQNAVDQSRAILDKLYKFLYEHRDVTAAETNVPADIMAALCDDLNTPLAISRLQALLKQEEDPALLKGQILAAGDLLNLLQNDPAQWLGYGQAAGTLDPQTIEDRLARREQARRDKDFATADAIRDELSAQGIQIEDTPQGPKWRRAG
jgi:cysteinyl-tRNA synthetase